MEPISMSDDFGVLLADARAGDAEALEGLLHRHLPPLRAFVRLSAGPLIRARESCSDLVQSVCRELLTCLGELECRDEQSFRRWLFTAARHKILGRAEHLRAQKRDPAREVEAPDGDPDVLHAYRSMCTPSQEAAIREEIERIESAFDHLADDHRRVILEACFLGRSGREIAEDWGRSEVAVRQLLARARARLALLLERP